VPAGPACAPLARFTEECPAEWTGAQADKGAFCAERAKAGGHGPRSEVNAFVSTDACRGWLRYTKHLFDAGPRYCLYDPKTQKLAGYRAYDGKAGSEAWSCGVDKGAYDDTDCSGPSC
jgi:hypothetical protein